MKYPQIVLLAILCSCAAPVSYVNNIPRSSGLEEGGDIRINANIGSDMRVRDKHYHLGAAWSPIESFGLAFEYNGHLKWDDPERRHEELQFYSGSLVYYFPVSDRGSLEFLLSAGEGKVKGNIAYATTFLLDLESFDVDAKYNTRSIQVNYNLNALNENSRVSMGARASVIRFDKYSYVRSFDGTPNTKSFEAEDWNVYILDPFIEANQNLLGKLYFNSRISYSLLDGQVNDNFRHPFFKRFGFTFGFQVKL